MARTKTPERIAEMALNLFNELGEPNVTTNRIADELDMSPGNLHYHFRTKQDLVELLFGRYEQRMLQLLGGEMIDEAGVEDAWLFLHLVFEAIAEYRFIYRDLTELCARSRRLHQRVRAILKLSMETANGLLQGLERAEQLSISRLQRDTVVRNIVLISSYWIAFDQVLEPERQPDPQRAAWQVMTLVSPYMLDEARQQFESIASAYRN